MSVELAPVQCMLDETHDPLPTQRVQNAYTLGSIGGHNIVIAVMYEIGNNAAATTVNQLLNDFPAVKFGLLVGIGGGVPSDTDIRLGDVVVGQPTGVFPGVVQYDMGKELDGGKFQRTGSLNKPPVVLSASVRKLDSQHRQYGRNLSQYVSEMVQRWPAMQAAYSFPVSAGQDNLFLPTYEHQTGATCSQCDERHIVYRPTRPDHEPRIHYSTIASANKVVKDAKLRDKIFADTYALCVEMEAAGLMSDFPCLVIRGICDYADSHKNKRWQPYAAATAAAYMKALLLTLPTQEVLPVEHTAKKTVSQFQVGLHLTMAPFMEDDLSIDRSDQLDEMEQILQPRESTRKHCRLVLGGIGGIGKTQLAIMYAKRYQRSYDSIFWLNATSDTVLKQSIRSMMHRILGLEKCEQLDGDQILAHAIFWLSDPNNTRWLLIFDNYDEPDAYDIGRYCPYGAHGSAIITTRQPEEVQGQKLLIHPLKDVKQSLGILATRSKRADVYNDPNAFNLVKRLQGLPLALATVGAYLKNSGLTFEEYLKIYEEQFNVDSHRSVHLPEYRNRTLHTTWDITYNRLEADHATSARLLRSFAFFDNQHLQYALFHVSDNQSITRNLAKMRSRLLSRFSTQAEEASFMWLSQISPEEFESAMHVLIEYCFVEVRSELNDYSIHSCVHDWTLSNLKASTRSNGYWFAFDRVAALVGTVKPEDYVHIKHSTIAPHAARLTHVSFSAIAQSASRERLDSMYVIASFLRNQVQLDEAERMYTQVLAGRKRALGPNHPRTLATANKLGSVYRDQGKLKEAEEMYTLALAGYEKAFRPDRHRILVTVNRLGSLYHDQGKLEEAEQMYTRVMAGCEKTLQSDCRRILATVNDFGSLYRDQGKLKEAEQMYTQAMAGCETVFGLDHPRTLITVNNLGSLYHSQGKLEAAERMYTRALAGYEKALRPNHPWILTTIKNFGSLYRDQGKLEEAEQMLTRAMVGRERALES